MEFIISEDIPEVRVLNETEMTALSGMVDKLTNETLFSYSLFDVLMTANDFKSPYTLCRTQRVIRWSKQLAKLLNMDDTLVRETEISAMFCDIGMWAIPSEIINKRGRLSLDEFRIIQYHPEMTLRALDQISLNDRIRANILYHHESYDGSGYPTGLSGQDIPLGSQVINAACALYAITAKRPYREPISPDRAMEIIISEENRQFGKEIVSACREMHNAGQLKSVLDLMVKNPFDVLKSGMREKSQESGRGIRSIIEKIGEVNSEDTESYLDKIQQAIDD